MDELLKQIKDNWNETADSDWYQSLRTDEKIEELVKEPANAFHPALHQMINKYIPDLHGKKVLLPSSGDNHAAFAFALLGAEVTSTDISEKQLEYAQKIANNLNLSISFVCDDITQLSNIEDNSFDLVYTSNGTHTWIADIVTMYKNIYRVLKPSGFSIMFDIHPFNRPFTGEPWKQPIIIKSYEETMPHCLHGFLLLHKNNVYFQILKYSVFLIMNKPQKISQNIQYGKTTFIRLLCITILFTLSFWLAMGSGYLSGQRETVRESWNFNRALAAHIWGWGALFVFAS